MDINLNQKCTVVLAERGVEALQKYYKDLHLEPPKDYKAGDEYTSEFWEIMHIFGGCTYMGRLHQLKPRYRFSLFRR